MNEPQKKRQREAGIRWRREHEKSCPLCGKPMSYNSNTCRLCYLKIMTERNLAVGRKQTIQTDRGYKLIYAPLYPSARKDGYMCYHRWIVEQHIERQLMPNEQVHHLNGIRNDNRIENLVIVNKHSHERSTLLRLCRKRIRQLEAQLSQHFLPLKR